MEPTVKPGGILQTRYRFEHPIGHGAYGIVWKAWHEQLQRPLAIKVIDTQNLDPVNLERVKHECMIGGQLGSDVGVVQVLDAFEHDDHLFIVMELMEGGSLNKVLKGKPPELALTLSWALDICDAMRQVHAHDIIHRDIKPQNILLTGDGHPKLSDFGIAHLPHASITSYQPGTPGYRAPELEDGCQVTPAADVYSLSAVFFELWSCRPYSQYKALAQDLVYREFLTCMANEYPAVPEGVSDALIDTLLAGLTPDPAQRMSLEKLRSRLAWIQQMHETPSEVLEEARDTIVSELRPEPSAVTLVSTLVQVPLPQPSDFKGETALVGWIADEFGTWFLENPDHEIILWFDPEREWESVLPLLEPHLDLIRDEGSFLKVRYQLEKREVGRQVVVYSPRSSDEADYLKPFTFLGWVFKESLYEFLLAHDIPLPQYGAERQEVQSVLPLLAGVSCSKGAAFWDSVKSIQDAENLLVPNFRERLFQLMINPELVWKDLEGEALLKIFLRMVERRYGFSSDRLDSVAFAQKLFAHWLIVDIYIRAGQPDDYPFATVLPNIMAFTECCSDLDAFRHDSRYLEIYRAYIDAFEQTHPSISAWGVDYPSLQVDSPLLSLASHAWSQMLERIQSWQEREQVLTDLKSLNDDILQRAEGYWAQRGVVPGWRALKEAVNVILSAETGVEKSEGLTKPASFVQAYVEDWWQVDQEYRHYQMRSDTSANLGELTKWVDHFYEYFLEQVNIRWTESLFKSSTWPPANTSPAAHEASESLWIGEGRKAIFIVDALRFELAKELEGQLQGRMVSLSHWIAALPTITPIGMSGLVPCANKRRIDWENGWKITLEDFEKNLAEKSGRTTWMEHDIANMISLPLHKWLQPDTEAPEGNQTLIVFSDELDAWGETASELSVGAFSDLLQEIVRGVRKALDMGYETVHVVTDHGFLLLGEVAEHGKIELKEEAPLKVAHRYLIGRALPATEGLLRYPVFGSNDLVGWYPPGIACFKVGGRYNFAHGGLSLQEVIIPYLQVQQDVTRVAVGVRLVVDKRIYSGVFKVVLKPAKPGLFVKEREARLILQNSNGEEIQSSIEIVGPEESVTKNLKIGPGDGVKFGEMVIFVVKDANTGEELDRKRVEVHVDLEL